MDASTPPELHAPAAGYCGPVFGSRRDDDAEMTAFGTNTAGGPALSANSSAVPGGSAVRMICRHSSRLLLDRTHRWAALVLPERSYALVLQTVLSASLAHLPWRDPISDAWIGVEDATTQGRPVSVLSISQSLDLSFASVARRVDDLIAAGLMVKERRGVRVAPSFFASGRVDAAAAGDRQSVQQCMDLLADAGHDPAPALRTGGLARVPDPVIARTVLAYSLRVLESVKQLYGDAGSGMLIVTVIAANIDHLLADPALDRQFADQDNPPPDELRRGITVRELARRADIPFETTRRRVNDLLARDMLENRADGLILPRRVLLRPAQMADNVRVAGHFHWLLATLSDLAAIER